MEWCERNNYNYVYKIRTPINGIDLTGLKGDPFDDFAYAKEVAVPLHIPWDSILEVYIKDDDFKTCIETETFICNELLT